jgi:hypothetical protein
MAPAHLRWALVTAALVLSSGAALADCTGSPGVNILASLGQTCFAGGPYVSTDVVAGEATGAGSVLTNVSEGTSSVSFSTSAANTAAVEANAGGLVTLFASPPDIPVTVTTTGNDSIGLYATGTDELGTASQIVTQNVSVSTTGADTSAVGAASGGDVSLTGGAVTSTGLGSKGLFVSGAGSTITASGVTVTTSGNYDLVVGSSANGLFASSGGRATDTGGSINTTGIGAYAVVAESGGVITLAGTTIGTTGNGSGGLGINGVGSEVDATGVSITTTGAFNSGPVQHAYGVYNGPYGSFPSGGIAKLTDSSVSTQGAQMHGVVTDSGGATTILGGSISTAGSGAHAILSLNGGATTVGVSEAGPTTLATTGTSAAGVVAYNGGAVALIGASVTTTGEGSTGLAVNGATSSLTATGIGVTTQGGVDPATSFHADGAFNGPSGSLSSGGLLSLTNSTITTSGAGANGVSTSTGGRTTVSGGSVMTTGLETQGISVGNGGQVTMSAGSVTTSGNGSQAIEVYGAGSMLRATGVNVTTSGTIDASTGHYVVGLSLNDGAAATFSGGSITTKGASNTGVASESSAGAATSVTLADTPILTTGLGSIGMNVSGPNASITADGISITTQGNANPSTGNPAFGAYNGNNTVLGIPIGGALSLTNSTITTAGASADGVVTSAGGMTTISGGSVKTTGLEALGVIAEGGGNVTISGTAVATTGDASKGLAVFGAGSSLAASNLTVATSGTINSATGDHAYAIYNGYAAGTPYTNGGTVTLTNVTAQTTGATSSSVVTNSGGVTNISGGVVETAGQDAHTLVVTGPGSTVNLSGANTFLTLGAGAIGLYANQGGVVNATGAPKTTITTAGGVSPATGLGAYAVNADGAGSKITLGSATIMTAGASALLASDRSASGTAGTITASGTLGVLTENPAAAAVALQGNGATITATGGGLITSAGDLIEFTNATNAVATFDNFTIDNLSGDLVFADPSTATVNFNGTTAVAGLNNLLDATNGSDITLNANASTLAGAIKTDPTSTTNVNLTNGTTWAMTGSSNVTNLAVTNSVVVFAPPNEGGGFKTLTVTNYTGSGANIAMNVALGGSNSATDQIIVNGGKATGSTLLTVKNVGGLGAHTTGAGIPLVITTNGGTVARGAFALANTPLAGGFRYMLQESNNDWYLVSTPAPTLGQVQGSINQVAKAQQTQIITNRVLNSILLGATQQISSCSCSGGFASVGSFAAGAQGRWGLSDELSLIGGFSYNQWYASGISVDNAPTVAGALIYDLWKWGESRPFFEAGGALTPYEDIHYTRYYPNGLTTGVGAASAIDRNLSLFARAGWIDRFSPVDEAAVYGDFSRNWMQTGGYAEMASAVNPFPTTVSSGLDTLNVARLGGQITHLFGGNIEANVSAAVAYGFGAGAGAATSVLDFGSIAPNALPNTTWMEWGARLGYRFNDRLVVDAFVIGTAFGEVGTTVHGGVALRYAF